MQKESLLASTRLSMLAYYKTLLKEVDECFVRIFIIWNQPISVLMFSSTTPQREINCDFTVKQKVVPSFAERIFGLKPSNHSKAPLTFVPARKFQEYFKNIP